jgi:hypothetical protein
MTPLQRTLSVYGGGILLLVGNYFLVGSFSTEPLALSVVGAQNVVYIDILFFLMYGLLCLTAMVTVSYTLYSNSGGKLPSEARLTLLRSLLVLIIAHVLVLYIPLFTGIQGLPVLY